MLSEKARLNIAHTLSVRPLLCACKGRVRPHVHALLACPPCNPRTCMHPLPTAHVCNEPHGMCPFHVCAPSCSPRVRVRPPCVRVRTLAAHAPPCAAAVRWPTVNALRHGTCPPCCCYCCCSCCCCCCFAAAAAAATQQGISTHRGCFREERDRKKRERRER